MKQKPLRILIILPRRLGDVLLGTPLAQVLKQRYPGAAIDWWAHPMSKVILEDNPCLNQIFYYPVWKIKKNIIKITYFYLWLRFLFKSVAFVFKVRAQHYDIVIDAMNYPRSALQTWLTGAQTKISFATGSLRDKVYTHLISREELNNGYLGHTKLKLLLPLNISLTKNELKNIRGYFPIIEQNKLKPQEWLKKHFLTTDTNSRKEHSFCTMSPAPRSAAVLNRCWPASAYVQLAYHIIQKYDCTVVWLFAPDELPYIMSIHEELNCLLKKHKLKTQMNLMIPQLSLREIAYLTTHAQGWIGNCNGMGHIAVALGVKTITLYGPTKPQNWAHPDKTTHRAVQRKVGCIQCSNNTCKLTRRECLDDLKVGDVFEEVEKLFFSNS